MAVTVDRVEHAPARFRAQPDQHDQQQPDPAMQAAIASQREPAVLQHADERRRERSEARADVIREAGADRAGDRRETVRSDSAGTMPKLPAPKNPMASAPIHSSAALVANT